MEDRELLFKDGVTHSELQKEFAARLELLEIALNRRFPERAEWKCSFAKDGDIEIEDGAKKRFHLPQYIFYQKANALEVFRWFIEAVGLERKASSMQWSLRLKPLSESTRKLLNEK